MFTLRERRPTWILSGLGVGERLLLRGEADLDRLFSLFLSLSRLLSASFLASSGLLSAFGLSLAGVLFLCFFTDPLERDEADESDELDVLDDDDESEDELLDDLELELELLLLLEDLELLLEELSLLESRLFLPLSLASFLSRESFDLLPSSPAFRSLRSPVSLSGIFNQVSYTKN